MGPSKSPNKSNWEEKIFLFSGLITLLSLFFGNNLFAIILSFSILTVSSFFYNLKKRGKSLNWISTILFSIYTLLIISASKGNLTFNNYFFTGIILTGSLFLLLIHYLMQNSKRKISKRNNFFAFVISYLVIILLIINLFGIIYLSNNDIVYGNEELNKVGYSEFDYFYFSAQTFYMISYGDFVPVKSSRLWVLLEILTSFFLHVLILQSYFYISQRKECL